MTCGLPHLKRRADYLRAARDGRSWVTPGLILQVWRPDADMRMQDPPRAPRLGITASRKVGNAVARNRVRRRLRAAGTAVLPKLAAAPADYVIIGRAATLTRPFPALLGDLATALRRLKALRADGSKALRADGSKALRAGVSTALRADVTNARRG